MDDYGIEIDEIKEVVYVCLVCGYRWSSPKNKIPLRCAKYECRSHLWNIGQIYGNRVLNKSNFINTKDSTFDNDNKLKIYKSKKFKLYRKKYRTQIYNDRIKEQNGVCAICGKSPSENKRLSLDHDHDTQQLRGLLCTKCNLIVGTLENNDLRKAIEYIEKWDKLYEEEVNKKSESTNKVEEEELNKKLE